MRNEKNLQASARWVSPKLTPTVRVLAVVLFVYLKQFLLHLAYCILTFALISMLSWVNMHFSVSNMHHIGCTASFFLWSIKLQVCLSHPDRQMWILIFTALTVNVKYFRNISASSRREFLTALENVWRIHNSHASWYFLVKHPFFLNGTAMKDFFQQWTFPLLSRNGAMKACVQCSPSHVLNSTRGLAKIYSPREIV